ncbi:exodeoxyribonuclease VII large subunit [Acuticoccus sp. M5D2P5]|uniref:exodeoxyribonuclease VII large subunit n=1 Tax=Acuticoccus kalidii TaxID=2910977 RepID=UPI001F1CDF20|nr:exodeoxyribonuclease VII large subunit [Acuticoccus kalidii]MCF3931855.1 exodeoxyribonuclease VII large subunit [Acuticoccus kalidii]
MDDADPPRSNAAEFTVSELSRAVKRTVEDGFGHVRVRGEISGFRGRHSSGHCYFSLKDVDASIDAVVWRGSYARLGVKPEEGLEVIASGRLTTFAKKSSYQLVVDQLEHAGLGALMKLLEERRKKLAAEGLFDEARKRPLPTLPRVIGVVTSPTGAVIRDILHRVADRFPTHVVVWPVRVQGETSGAEVAAAVEGFAGAYGGPRPDVIIVARGGGSVEDLWGYNDEAVVRAVVASPIPVVSAVGHETDWTLIDHAADHRAPTPTGAAERVVPVRSECLATLSDRARRLDVAMATLLNRRSADLRLLARGLPVGPALLQTPRQRLDMSADKLVGALFKATAEARRRYLGTASRLSPHTARRPLVHAADRLSHTAHRLTRAADAVLTERRGHALRTGARLHPLLLERRLVEAKAETRRLVVRRDRAIAALLTAERSRLDGSMKLLTAVSYTAVLSRGFALVRRENDDPVHAAADIAPGEALELEFADGRVRVVEGTSGARPAMARIRPVRRSKKADDDTQGDLF